MSNEISATTKPALIDRVGEKVEPRLRSILRRVPPRVSLLTGGVFILITLYLPLAVNSCGDYSGQGRDIVQGKQHEEFGQLVNDSNWPSFTDLSVEGNINHSTQVGRWFYIFLLAWATFAVLLTLGSLVNRGIPGRRPLPKWFLAIGGAISLLVLADYCAYFVGVIGASLLDWMGIDDRVYWVGCPLLTFLVCTRCLRAKSVRASIAVCTVFILGGGLSLVAGVLEAYQVFRKVSFLDKYAGGFVVVTPTVLYVIAPLSLWYCHAIWPGRDSLSDWVAVRRRLALIYVPAVAGQFFAAYFAIFDAHVWGLIPCLIGIHLITLGYMRLAQQAEAALDTSAVPAGHPVTSSA